ncbi:MAG TPA: exosortase/archaeosortase family protein [Kiritimatiellia bacterium]|nr:exosortase/archaeosortase family protein [Kiritimatiellia bacterium]HMO98158.1 exosortase/archaeosortase family protein [Kiritimatiellia bacterium]HMP96670.1 exosortase/archaeosortase family protein [Kiritimatiellia bacterium]
MEREIWSEQWRLAALNRSDILRATLVAVVVGLVFGIFHYQGNSLDINAFGRSALSWMVERWTDDIEYGGDYSHGWLVPILSIYVIWYRRKALAAATKNVSLVGLVMVIGCLFLHWLGMKAQQTRISLFALVGLTWSIPFYLYGWQVAKQLIFPCAYLVFCIPMNFLDSVTHPLRLFATEASAVLLNGIGIGVEASGARLHSLTPGGFDLDVADACSGIRSLTAITALTAIYANITQRKAWKQWAIFALSIPLAIIGNIVRVFTTGIVAELFGTDTAMHLYHDFSGFIIFMVVFILLISAGSMLDANWLREKKQLWLGHLRTT